jgi:hypothetical protein
MGRTLTESVLCPQVLYGLARAAPGPQASRLRTVPSDSINLTLQGATLCYLMRISMLLAMMLDTRWSFKYSKGCRADNAAGRDPNNVHDDLHRGSGVCGVRTKP